MLFNIAIAVCVVGFFFAFLAILWGLKSLPDAPTSHAYDGVTASPVLPPNELRILPESQIPFEPSRPTDWRHNAFESALLMDEALKSAGWSDDERASMIDQTFGNKLFRAKKQEPQS